MLRCLVASRTAPLEMLSSMATDPPPC
ncbi:MAG: hypothetical protein H7145_21690 [Akkermansiaceae bacterium]|nr:hypothetical protein [Armatimonadota bacterium]